MTEPQAETPRIDTVGTWKVEEPLRKTNPLDGISYEIPRGDYPVLVRLTDDGKQAHSAAVVFTAPSPTNGRDMDIVEFLRPIEIPAMVQRREITLDRNVDRALRIPLSLFTGVEQRTQVPEKVEAPDHRLSIARRA